MNGLALRELNERWNDALTLHGRSIAEQYVNGRLSIALQMNLAARNDSRPPDPKWADDKLTASNEVTSLILNFHVANFSDRYVWDQQEMFVFNVEIVKCAKDLVTVPSSVRAYVGLQTLESICSGLLYVSAINGGYKSFSGITKWKFKVAAAATSFLPKHLGDDEIERGASVVNRISRDQLNLFRDRFRNIDIESVLRGISILLHPDTVEITALNSSDCEIQIVDVFLGPFNL